MTKSAAVPANDTAWNKSFLTSLRRHLDAHQRNGLFTVERAEIINDQLITVLHMTRSDRRYGRVIHLPSLRSEFVPDRASGVADAWFQTLYPPGEWNEAHVVDGICWHKGQQP